MEKKILFLLIIIFLFLIKNINPQEQDQAKINIKFNPQKINIISPENKTYTFPTKDNNSLLLNASAHFQLRNWTYLLKNLETNEIIEEIVSQEPRFSIEKNISVKKGRNNLTVKGKDINLQEHLNNVLFLVNITNTAPIIENFVNQHLTCEGNEFQYFFSTYDEDEDNLNVDIIPKSIFFVRPFLKVDNTRLISEIYSGKLRKNSIGQNIRTVIASDGYNIDSKEINITVIEINNPPEIENIGVQTVWLFGEFSIFNKTIKIQDIETGNNPEDFKLDIYFSNKTLFNITKEGRMFYEPKEEDLGLHYISVCAEDKELSYIHPNISICSQNGSRIKTCQNFTLTVTKENRPPTIVAHYPKEQFINIIGSPKLTFSILKYDPDFTIPDSYWYFDSKKIAYFSGESNDTLRYDVPCGIEGTKELKVEITDGLLNDSFTWILEISSNKCSSEITSSGGGGEQKIGECIPKIACEEWNTCKRLDEGLKEGLIFKEEYREMKNYCEEKGYKEENCGFQERICYDLKNCSSNIPKMYNKRVCFFTENPNCFDGILNCHNGSCEVLVDCGGPCAPCPTCSDGIQNQGEEGIDCGGPCPNKCSEKKKKSWIERTLNSKNIKIFLSIIFVVIMIIYRIMKLNSAKREKERIIHNYFKTKIS